MSTFCENAAFNCPKKSNSTPIERFSKTHTMNYIKQVVTDTNKIFLKIYLTVLWRYNSVLLFTVLLSIVSVTLSQPWFKNIKWVIPEINN